MKRNEIANKLANLKQLVTEATAGKPKTRKITLDGKEYTYTTKTVFHPFIGHPVDISTAHDGAPSYSFSRDLEYSNEYFSEKSAAQKWCKQALTDLMNKLRDDYPNEKLKIVPGKKAGDYSARNFAFALDSEHKTTNWRNEEVTYSETLKVAGYSTEEIPVIE